MFPIVNDLVVNDLADERDRRLCSIFVYVRHIQIVHEVDQALSWWWADLVACPLLDLGLENGLKSLRVCVGVETDGG